MNFWADQLQLSPGQCTTLRWDVEGVSAVYLNVGNGEEGVTGHGTRQVCPSATTSYLLRVVHRDGRQELRSVSVTVGGVAPHP